MKICPECAVRYASAAEACPACGFRVPAVGGFPAYAPVMAEGGGGFKSAYFERLAALEAGNFWFRGRNRIIVWALRRYAAGFSSMLEVGCGTGFVLAGNVSAFPQARFVASEIFSAGLPFAAQRVPAAELLQMDARAIPYDSEFDVVGAFDVVEHIPEDAQVLRQMHQALKPGGTLVLTVPQHQWLWSVADEYAMHQRRYDARGLHALLRNAGFELTRSTSFLTLLLPAMGLSRLLGRSRTVADFDAEAELRLPRWLNAAFDACLRLELAAMKLGLNWPWGGSRLVVARKI